MLFMSVPIFSNKDNYYIFIPGNYVYFGGGVTDIYKYIYIYIYILVQFICHAVMLLCTHVALL